MRKHFRHVISMLMVLVFMGISMDVRVSAADYDSPPVLVAYLSGSQQTPSVHTAAQGRVMFYLSNDGNELYFKLHVTSIDDSMAAHIHLGSKGKSGHAVAALFDLNYFLKKGSFNGTVSEGVITSEDLIGPLVGSSFSALLREMSQGETYVNVHTKDYPRGYIRGQIVDPDAFQDEQSKGRACYSTAFFS